MAKKQKTSKPVSSVKDWKKPQGEPLELPSGHVCLCRAIGPQAFLASGAIPNALMPMVEKAIKQAEGGRPASQRDIDQMLEDIVKDPQKLQEVFDMADAVTVKAVIEPHVVPTPPPNEDGSEPERDPDLLYVDEVDMEDKFFIMQFAMGGTRELEPFRSEIGSNVGVVVDEQDVDDDAGAAHGVAG